MLITSSAVLLAAVSQLSSPVSLDLETTGLSPFEDKITMGVVGDAAQAFAFAPELITSIPQFNKPLVLHNQKFDMHMLYRAGVDIRCMQTWDTMLLHHLFDENASHSLGDIVLEMFQDTYKKDFWDRWKRIENAPEAEVIEYALKDAIYTRRVYDRLRAELHAEEVPESLIVHVHSLARALYDTEIEGVGVDLKYLVDLGQELTPLIAKARQEMQHSASPSIYAVQLDQHAKQINKLWKPRGKKWQTLPLPEFNWNSHQQVGSLLYEKLGLPTQYNIDKITKEKRVSTDDAALEKIENLHPLPRQLREYAGYQKVYTAFIEGTLERVRGSRIYPNFNVNGTVTGRISSSDPNLQQLPASGEWARVRGIYVPEPGHCIISADYDQLEVVIAAHFSQDPNLLRIVLGGESKHDITAAALGIQRGTAKTINFAMQYGCGPKKVSEILNNNVTNVGYRLAGISREDLERKRMQDGIRAWNQYWQTYAGEKEVVDECAAKVAMGEPIVSPWGRRRHFPSRWAERWMQKACERQAYSALIQGTGADCCHWAFYTLSEELKARGWGRTLFEVHDQIVCSIKSEHAADAAKLIEATMLEAGKQISLSVPLKVKVEAATERWVK